MIEIIVPNNVSFDWGTGSIDGPTSFYADEWTVEIEGTQQTLTYGTYVCYMDNGVMDMTRTSELTSLQSEVALPLAVVIGVFAALIQIRI